MTKNWKPVEYVIEPRMTHRPEKVGLTAYCSPACGVHCLKSDYEKAVKEAAKWAQEMKASTQLLWYPRVWENMGWHWEVFFNLPESIQRHPCKKVSLHLGRGVWTCYFNSENQFIGEGEDPLSALKQALRLSIKFTSNLHSDLKPFGHIKVGKSS